ncbi:MAG: hypothetical protein LUF33_01400 [Clostridiales bacterium]|nr:hypothetical protein [Clostridiales bacterium]
MKKYNSFKKTVAVLMSLSIICAPSITLNVCAAENSSQYVSEADADDVDKSALYDALYNYEWFEGFNLTVEYYENVKAAEEMALKVYNNPDATQVEVDEATAVLVETRYNFIECNWQDELIGRYYEYGAYVKKITAICCLRIIRAP